MFGKMYEPQEDSELLKKEVITFAFGRVLDVGCGSGIQSEAAFTNTKDVTGIDIDEEALNYCKQKYQHIKFEQSDLFTNVKGKYDTIIFNPPYLPQDPGIDDKALYGGKKGYEVIQRFIENVGNYLNKNGIILLLFSSLTNKKKVDEFIEKNLFNYIEIATSKHFFEKLYVYKISKKDILNKLKDINDLSFHAKGRRGLVYIGKYKEKKVAIKIKNPKSRAIARIDIEGENLKKVNMLGIGPKLIKSDKDYLIMEFVEGISFDKYIEERHKIDTLIQIDLIEKQLKILDDNKLEKDEMNRPFKNVIISNRQPVLIDFERLRYKDNPKNVRQFYEFKKRFLHKGMESMQKDS